MRSVAVCALILFAFAETACSSSGGSQPQCDAACRSDLNTAFTAGQNYTYQVTGDGVTSGVITYTGTDGAIDQATDAALPWSLTLARGPSGILSAQDAEGGTTITCSILDGNNAVIDTNTATGPFAIAQCQAGS